METKDYKLIQESNKVLDIVNQILQKELENPKNTLITLNRVKLSADLSKAIIFYTVFPDNKLGTAKRFFKNKRKFIQFLFNKEWRLYRKPRLIFLIDNEEIEKRNLDLLLDKIEEEIKDIEE